MSIVVTHVVVTHVVVTHVMVAHIVVAHVALVVHYSCTSVRHWSRIVLCNRSRCGLVHVSIV